ncbi:hypothetical protein P3W45_001636 [Vairimorpha bombi]|jgi:20S proteasome subunit beta 7
MKNFVIGSGIISFKYKDGVITASDTQASYGSLCKFTNLTRIYKLSPNTLVSLSGEVSDIQKLVSTLFKIKESDPVGLSTSGYLNLVQSILYNKRNRVEPYNVSVNILGYDNKLVLGAVNHLGLVYEDDIVSTGLSSMIALPYLRSILEGRSNEISREEAIKIAEDAMRIMCYKSCRHSNQIQIGIIEKEYINISEQYSLSTNWEMAVKENEIMI